jgi:tetratricopeptide (TPR) repeat protein
LERLSGQWTKRVLEKIPFWAASLLSGWITIIAQSQSKAFSAMDKLPMLFRISNAFHSVDFYLAKMFIPLDLAAFYPLPPDQNIFSIPYLASDLLVIGISIICWHERHRQPFALASWIFYFLTLAPVLGFLQVGTQAAADRYTYIPSFGVFLFLACVFVIFFSTRRWIGVGIALAVTLAMGMGTRHQLGLWKDSVSLWENVVRITPDVSEVTYTNLANAYRGVNRLDDALTAYDQALAIGPPNAIPHDGKGIVLFEQGKVQEAIEELKTAIGLDPQFVIPHQDLWLVYNRMGLQPEALEQAQATVRIQPDYAEAYNDLAVSLGSLNRFGESIQAFQKALQLDPSNAKYLVNLATTYQRAGKYDEAVGLYKKGLLLDPNEFIYEYNLGNTYLLKGSYTEALEALGRAGNLQPQNPGVYQKLADVYEKMGQGAKAADCTAKALSLEKFEKK